jgi:hypothetical protein
LLKKNPVLTDIVFWYSINSLTVFPVHLTIKVLSIPLLAKIGLNHWSCLFFLMFFFSIPIVNIINVYFPFMLGTFKSKRS